MEEELKELAKAYADAAKDFSAAATLEMVSNDILKLLLSHMDDGR